MFSPLPKNIFTFLLTSFSVPPSLSSAMKTALQKTASFLVSAFLYAIAGYAFFFVFFASQL